MEENTEEKVLEVTHEGIIEVMGIELKVFCLNNGKRVIEKESMDKLFEAMANGNVKMTEEDSIKIAEFIKLGKF